MFISLQDPATIRASIAAKVVARLKTAHAYMHVCVRVYYIYICTHSKRQVYLRECLRVCMCTCVYIFKGIEKAVVFGFEPAKAIRA